MSKNLDLNKVTEYELWAIQGIGRDNAKKIVEYRNQHGPFKSWEDLTHVPGMLGIVLETLKNHGCTIGKAA